VSENYRLLFGRIGFPLSSLRTIRQVHGTAVVSAPTETFSENPEEILKSSPIADAIVTRDRGVALLIRVADCFPLLLAEPSRGVIGACHAGWRGTLNGILSETIGFMREEFATEASDLFLAIGPGIGIDRFEVSSEVAARFESRFPESSKGEVVRSEGSIRIDLARVNVRLALEAGIRADRIWTSNLCTHRNPERFFSFRRDGEKSGRMAAWIGWSS
jgi:YfiH family protein